MPLQVLPSSTQRILDFARGKLPVHPGLELTKFVPWVEKERSKTKADDRTAFRRVIDSLSRAKDLAAKWRERRSGWLTSLGECALRFEAETVSPCVLWLAAPTALELGFCLHHTYGIPYLPGSALKGVARRQCLWANNGTDNQPDAETLRLFGEGGDKGHAGLVDFLDGIPLAPACLELDVMSPHHPEYYAGKNPVPHDCEDPVPLTFLRIKVGAQFELAVLGGTKGTAADLLRARELLLEALSDLGLGAKTSSGYGLFGEPGAAPMKTDGGGGPGAATVREVVAVVKSFDQTAVVFADEDGKDFSLSRKDLDVRFQMTQRRWNELRKSALRVRLAFKGERVDSMEQVKA